MTTTKKLVWRLGKLPSVSELEGLHHEGIITKDEVREVLFSSETAEDRDKKSLESEIKFLRDLVEKLSRRDNGQIVEIIKTIEVPYRRYDWYKPYEFWCGTVGNTVDNIVGFSVNSKTETTTMGHQNFSTIKTF